MLFRITKVVALLAVATVTAAWNEIPMTEENTKVHISLEAEGWELWRDRHRGVEYLTEYRWWTLDEDGHTGEVAFWYATEDSGYWNRDLIHKRGFLTESNWLKDRDAGKSGLSEGPTLATVVGDIETTVFSAKTQKDGEDLSECFGFRHWWGPYRNSYKRILDFYVCALEGNRVTEDQFLDILSGLSIKWEFDALIEQ